MSLSPTVDIGPKECGLIEGLPVVGPTPVPTAHRECPTKSALIDEILKKCDQKETCSKEDREANS